MNVMKYKCCKPCATLKSSICYGFMFFLFTFSSIYASTFPTEYSFVPVTTSVFYLAL